MVIEKDARPNRAARYFGGFGAGKSQIAVEGTVKDGTGKLLAEFSQKRVGAMGAFGRDSPSTPSGLAGPNPEYWPWLPGGAGFW